MRPWWVTSESSVINDREADTHPERDAVVALPGLWAVAGHHQDHDVDQEHRGDPRPRQRQPKTALSLHCYCCSALIAASAIASSASLYRTPRRRSVMPRSSPPAATHTGTISRCGAGFGRFSGADSCCGGFAGPSGTSQVSAATGSTMPWPTWLSTPRAGARAVRVNRLMTWYADSWGILGADQRGHAGHDRGREAGAGRNQQRVVRAVDRVDQAVVAGREPDDVGPGRGDPHPRAGDTRRTLPLTALGQRPTIVVDRADGQDVVAEPGRRHHGGDTVPVAGILGCKGSKAGFCLQSFLLVSPAAATMTTFLSTAA